MYAVTVEIDGYKYLVPCTPKTPHSEILKRATYQAEEAERRELEARTEPYRAAVAALVNKSL
jgi:hypothetical protein